MAAVASGCITIWEGGSLWAFHVPEAGDTPPSTELHAHHALQVTLALDGEFTLRWGDGEGEALHGPAALVAADAPHAFSARGDVAILFVEPESPAGRALASLLPPGSSAVPLPLPRSADLIERILTALRASPPDRGALEHGGRELTDAIARGATGGARDPAIRSHDPRVRRMIDWASAHLTEGVDIESAARAVDLSPSRASHLFAEHTGLAFRTWLLWLRAMRAVERYAAGDSLTDAAHEAGFADSAHLSRTFKRLFGLPATVLTLR